MTGPLDPSRCHLGRVVSWGRYIRTTKRKAQLMNEEPTPASDFSLDRETLHDACDIVRHRIRTETLLYGLSRDNADTLVDNAVTMYIKARVRRRGMDARTV